MKKLSIIIPVYNTEKYIKECLNSLEKYVDDQIEILIINDGSTDNSEEICKQFKKIRVINKINGGVSSARNLGIEKSNGEYIMFVDSDDLLNEEWKNKILKCLETEDDFYLFSKEYNKQYKKDELVKMMLEDKIQFAYSIWSKIYNKKIIDKYKIKFNEKIINGEDFLFNLQYLLKCERIRFIDECIYRYRITKTSSTRKFNEKIFNSDQELYLELDKLFLNEKSKIEEKKYIKYKNNILKNNLYVVFLRICYIRKYDEIKKYSIYFDNYVSEISGKTNIGLFKEIICYFIKKKLYLIAYCIIIIKNMMINNKEYLLDI